MDIEAMFADHVTFSVRLGGEGDWALRTFEWLLTSVSKDVSLQTADPGKCTWTVWTLQLVGRVGIRVALLFR